MVGRKALAHCRSARARALAWGLAAALLAAPASGQGIVGRVIDADTEAPVAEAAVALVDSAGARLATSRTDSAGAFGLPVVRPGRYTLDIRHTAYRDTRTRALDVARTDIVEVDIRLSRLTFELDPLVVTARRVTRASYLRGYYDRVDRHESRGWGEIVTREELEMLEGYSVGDLMRRSPGTGRFASRIGLPCPPTYYWNGRRIPAADIPVSHVEGIEVYRRGEIPSEVLAELYHVGDEGRIGPCGVVVVWSRALRPGEGRPWSALRLAAAVAAGLIIIAAAR